MRKLALLPLALVLVLFVFGLVACSDDGPTAPDGLPVAAFEADAIRKTSAFVVTYHNRSTASDRTPVEQAPTLANFWDIEGATNSNLVTPPDVAYRLSDLGLTEGVAGSATRTTTLTVTEDNDPTRRSTFARTLVFEVENAARSASESGFTVWLAHGAFDDAETALAESPYVVRLYPSVRF